MTNSQWFLVGFIIIAAIAILVWVWYRSRKSNKVSGMAHCVWAIWAALGPFKSGAESAAAMRSANLAVLGAEEVEKMEEGLADHAVAFDSDPTGWEEIRKEAAQLLEHGTKNLKTLAKNVAAMDDLNKNLYEFFGRNLDLAGQADGSLSFIEKKIKPDEKREESMKQFNNALHTAMGKSLIDDSSKEARVLKAFLADQYKVYTKKEADSASAIGKAWFACHQISNDEAPESELARKFNKINKAYLATIPDGLTKTIFS